MSDRDEVFTFKTKQEYVEKLSELARNLSDDEYEKLADEFMRFIAKTEER